MLNQLTLDEIHERGGYLLGRQGIYKWALELAAKRQKMYR
jgi:hypothetical protein